MRSDNRLQELQSEVKRLEEAFQAERAATRRSSQATLAIAISLSLVVVAFVIANFVNLSSEWTQEKFSVSLEKELHELQPKAQQELEKLSNEVLPIYMEEGKKQIEKSGPEMAARFEAELDLLCRDVTSGVSNRLEDSQKTVLADVEKAISKNFPDLGEDVKSQILEKRFRGITQKSLANAMNKFDAKFGAHVEDFEKNLLTFDVSTQDGENSVDLQKKFLSLWLDLLKEEIMAL